MGGQQHSKAVTVETCGAQLHERLVSSRNQPRGLGKDTPCAQLIEGKHLRLVEKSSVEHLADAHINGRWQPHRADITADDVNGVGEAVRSHAPFEP